VNAPHPDARFRQRRAVVVFLVLAGLIAAALVAGRGVLLPFLIAGIVAYLLAPLVDRLQSAHIPRWVTVILAYVCFFTAVYGFGIYLVPKLGDEASRLVVQLRRVAEAAPDVAERLDSTVQVLVDAASGPKTHAIESSAPPAPLSVEEEHERDQLERRKTAQLLFEKLDGQAWGVTLNAQTLEMDKREDGRWQISARRDDAGPVKGDALKQQVLRNLKGGAERLAVGLVGELLAMAQGLVTGVLGGLVYLVVTLMIGAYILIDLPRLQVFYRGLVPLRFRSDWDELRGRLDDGLSGVVRGQLIICVINGVLSGIGFAIFIPDFAVVLGLLAGVLTLVPIFGTFISSIPACLVGLSDGWGTSFAVLGWILLIHFFEANVWNPKIIGSQANIHPVVVVLSLVFGEHFFGLKGALFAVPVVAVVRALYLFAWARIRHDWLGEDDSESPVVKSKSSCSA